MKKLLLCIFCIFSCSCNQSYAPKPVVVVYPYWKHSTSSLAKLPWDKFSHIAVASVYPLASGSIKSDQLDPFINDLIELAHSKGKKVIELQNHVDFVNLMAFDFTGAWPESEVAHHSDFRTFKKALEYIISNGFVKEKILVGLPAYGIEFIDGKKDQIKHVAYSDIVAKMGGDDRALAKGNLGALFFENSKNISKKCLHVAKMGAGGVFLFDVLSDHEDDSLSLLSACNKFIPPLTIFAKDNK